MALANEHERCAQDCSDEKCGRLPAAPRNPGQRPGGRSMHRGCSSPSIPLGRSLPGVTSSSYLRTGSPHESPSEIAKPADECAALPRAAGQPSQHHVGGCRDARHRALTAPAQRFRCGLNPQIGQETPNEG